MQVYLSLQPGQPLTMCVVDNENEETEIRICEELDHVTQAAIETLHAALNLCYFDRVMQFIFWTKIIRKVLFRE